MKNLLLLLLVSFLLGACDDPSSPNKGVPNSITGKVQLFNSDEDEPYPDHSGATVAIRGTSFTTTTNTAGEYTFNGVPPGLYVLSYAKSGFDSSFANVEYSGVGVEFLNTVSLKSHYKINRLDGHVTLLTYNDSIIDHSGVNVSIDGAGHSTVTDVGGNYSFNNVPKGSFELVFTKLGFNTERINVYYPGKGVSKLQSVWLHTPTWIFLDSLYGGTAEDLVDSGYTNWQAIPSQQQVLLALGRTRNIATEQLEFTLYDGNEQTPDVEIPALAYKRLGDYYIQVLDRLLVEQMINEGKGYRGRMTSEVPGRTEVSNIKDIPRL